MKATTPIARAVLILCLGTAPAAVWAADPPPAAGDPARSGTIVVRVRLNTQTKGDLFVERAGRDFLVKVEDLKAIGFREPAGKPVIVDGEPHLSLASMAGVSFEFAEKTAVLEITADAGLLAGTSYAMRGQQSRASPIAPANSAFMNYALAASGAQDSPSSYSFSTEAGWRFGDYLLLSDANTVRTPDGGYKFVRLSTSVTHDDRDDLRRTVVGDFFPPSRDFSSGIGLGGISVSKLFGLNPYFVQFPLQTVTGTVALPSEMEVYLDGQRVRTERLAPGEFQVRDILAYGGARNVQLVLRDPFGRVQQLNYSFYFNQQALRQGLHEYSYNAGAIRRDFGSESNNYGPPAATMFHRYGLADSFTPGWRAEVTRDLVNTGPTATVVLGSAGVLNTALAASRIAGRRGYSGIASYTYQAKGWSLSASARRDWGDYASLGDPPTINNRKTEAVVSASRYLGRGTVSLSHSFLKTRPAIDPASVAGLPFTSVPLEPRDSTVLSYNTPLFSGRASFSASLSRITDPEGTRHELFASLLFFLDRDHTLAASLRRDSRSGNSLSTQLTKNQPFGEGLGYNISLDSNPGPDGDSLQLRSTMQLNMSQAIARAGVGHIKDASGQVTSDYSASIAGGIAYVGGEFAAGRPITGAFGITHVGELPGAQIMANGQVVARTNAQGKAFLPGLTPYYDNEISVAADSIPLNYAFEKEKIILSPPAFGGVLVDFKLRKIQAISGKLKHLQGGTIKPVEFRELRIEAKGQVHRLETGRGGEFYVENLAPGRYAASAVVDGQPCVFEFNVPESDEMFIELGDLQCRPAR